MKVTWLGQGGYLFETEGQRFIIDPFLSNIVEELQGFKRLVEPPYSIDELKPDFLFITHNHIDHFDPLAFPAIHEKYPSVTIAGPESVIKKAQELNFESSALVQVSKNKCYSFGCFKITATPAFHSDPFTVGCLLEAGGKLMYISSDTLFTPTLADEIGSLAQRTIDAIFICINGKFGNMNWSEAVTVVDQLKPQLAIPMHYGMFAENTEDPAKFIQACRSRRIDSIELMPGKEMII